MHCLFATSLPAYLTTHTSRHLFIQKLSDDGEERLLIPTFLHKTLCKLNWIIHHVAGSPALFRFEANLWNIKLNNYSKKTYYSTVTWVCVFRFKTLSSLFSLVLGSFALRYSKSS